MVRPFTSSISCRLRPQVLTLGFDSNKLTINVNKTKMIMLSRKKNLTPQKEILQNEVLQRVNKAKFLGVIVDQRLNISNS